MEMVSFYLFSFIAKKEKYSIISYFLYFFIKLRYFLRKKRIFNLFERHKYKSYNHQKHKVSLLSIKIKYHQCFLFLSLKNSIVKRSFNRFYISLLLLYNFNFEKILYSMYQYSSTV